MYAEHSIPSGCCWPVSTRTRTTLYIVLPIVGTDSFVLAPFTLFFSFFFDTDCVVLYLERLDARPTWSLFVFSAVNLDVSFLPVSACSLPLSVSFPPPPRKMCNSSLISRDTTHKVEAVSRDGWFHIFLPKGVAAYILECKLEVIILIRLSWTRNTLFSVVSNGAKYLLNVCTQSARRARMWRLSGLREMWFNDWAKDLWIKKSWVKRWVQMIRDLWVTDLSLSIMVCCWWY